MRGRVTPAAVMSCSFFIVPHCRFPSVIAVIMGEIYGTGGEIFGGAMTNSLIVTISDDTNYGNRLQNYALTQLLKAYGDCTTAKFVPATSSSYAYCKLRIKELLHLSGVKSGAKGLKASLRLFFSAEGGLTRHRFRIMEHFTKEYVPDDSFELTDYKGLVSKAGASFDTVVLGSDQIWNPNWLSQEDLELRLGSFAQPGIRVISYAASFGVSVVDDPRAREVFSKFLPRLSAVSVREDAGKALVEQLSNGEATVVLDPTLMIPTEKWLSITHSFVPANERYVLTYFLGKPTARQEQRIQQFAEEHNCAIRRMLDFRDSKDYLAGPEDFVELFSKAQYVFTDSYHACCFSILFQKQFTVFTRAGHSKSENMNSRMETLFRLFELDAVVSESELAPRVNYARVNELLEKHRQESRAWLDAAMGR